MPGMDGFDVLRVMKYHAWLDEIPVIVISAAEDTANIEAVLMRAISLSSHAERKRTAAQNTQQSF